MRKQAETYLRKKEEYDKAMEATNPPQEAAAANGAPSLTPRVKRRRAKPVDVEGRKMEEPDPKDHQSMYALPLVSYGRVIDVIGSIVLRICLGVRKDALDWLKMSARLADREILKWSVESPKAPMTEQRVQAARKVLEVDLPQKLQLVRMELQTLESECYGWALRRQTSSTSGRYEIGVAYAAEALKIRTEHTRLAREEPRLVKEIRGSARKDLEKAQENAADIAREQQIITDLHSKLQSTLSAAQLHWDVATVSLQSELNQIDAQVQVLECVGDDDDGWAWLKEGGKYK